MLIHPAALMAPAVTTADIFRTLAGRNVGSRVVLAAALVTQPKRDVAFLSIARGLTEWADAWSGVFRAPLLVPIVGGLGDLFVGAYFYSVRSSAPEAR